MGWREKFIEITEFVKNEEAMIKLEVDLAAMIKKDPVEAKKIQAKMAALRDANENMSIAPLIKAGEFSTISESLSEADVSIREGRWADFIENAVDKLPAGVSDVAKNVLMTKDSTVFRGLNRFVQYGDFVGKAVLYDHVME